MKLKNPHECDKAAYVRPYICTKGLQTIKCRKEKKNQTYQQNVLASRFQSHTHKHNHARKCRQFRADSGAGISNRILVADNGIDFSKLSSSGFARKNNRTCNSID